MQDNNKYENKNSIYSLNIFNFKSSKYARNLLAETKKGRRRDPCWGLLLILEGVPMAILIIMSGIIDNNNYVYFIIGVVALLISLSLGIVMIIYGSK